MTQTATGLRSPTGEHRIQMHAKTRKSIAESGLAMTIDYGVYMIEHIASGKKYVGSAARSISRRWIEHRHDLRKGIHHSRHLQRAWNKYGGDAFVWRIVKRTTPEEAIESEQAYIDLYQACDPKRGYNISPIAGSTLGYKHTDETRAKMSTAGKGRKFSVEHCAKLSASKKGHSIHTVESRTKLSAAMMGNKNLLGHKPTAETRAKISASLKGRKGVADL